MPQLFGLLLLLYYVCIAVEFVIAGTFATLILTSNFTVMKANVVVSSDVRGITLSIPQGMNGRQLAKFREANKDALQAARVAAKAGEPVAMVIDCEVAVLVPAEASEASEQNDEGDASARQ